VLAGALEDHYSPLRQYISELGRSGAAHPWIFSISVAIWGLGFLALAIALVPALRTRPWPKAMPLLFVLAGVCAIVVAPLRMDCATALILESTLDPEAVHPVPDPRDPQAVTAAR
jgi:hypothetical protein